MRIELHLHTSRYSFCATATASQLMEQMVRIGYGAVYITEHDAVWSDREIEQVQLGYPDIRIFPGVELSIGPELLKHLVVLGTNDPAYLALRDDPAGILAKARDEGHLTILAHPFRWDGAEEMLQAGLLPDALEYHTGNHSPSEAKVAEAASATYGLPLVNAGDVHSPRFLGRFWIETDRPVHKADDIRRVVMNRAYVNRSEKDR